MNKLKSLFFYSLLLVAPLVHGEVISSVQLNNSSGTFVGQGRNRVINGAMRIDQRNEGTAYTVNTTNVSTLDHWIATSHTTAGVYTVLKSTVNPPPRHTHSAKITVTTSSTTQATNTYSFNQRLEGIYVNDLNFGTVYAATTTLSFWVKSSSAGTFGGTYRNSGQTRYYVFNYTVPSTGTWYQKTVTIPGDQTGLWLSTANSVGLRLAWDLGAGSDFRATANTWATGNIRTSSNTVRILSLAAATWEIGGVQLEIGDKASTFEFLRDDIVLAQCERYYEKTFAQGVPAATNSGSVLGTVYYRAANAGASTHVQTWTFRVTKMTTPTFTFYNPSAANDKWRNGSDGADSASASGSVSANEREGIINNVQVAGDGVGEFIQVHADAESEL